MTLHQLAILRRVIEEKSFVRAAESLRVSQPAISSQIKALERELGCVLLKRKSALGPVEPTEAGRIVYKAALKIFENLDLLFDELSILKVDVNPKRRVLQLICDIPTGIYTLPPLVEEFRSKDPGTMITITANPHQTLPAILGFEVYDLALIPSEIPSPAAIQEFCFTQSLVAVANPELKTSAGPPSLRDCLPLVVPPKGSMVRKTIDTYLRKLGIKPNIVLELNHPEAVRKAVRTGPVASITHRVSVHEDLEAGALIELNLPQPLPPLTYKVVRTRSRLGEHVRAFSTFLRERLLN